MPAVAPIIFFLVLAASNQAAYPQSPKCNDSLYQALKNTADFGLSAEDKAYIIS
jgi:hypothetical protein